MSINTNESSENYLETILILSRKHPVVRPVDIATELDFKKSSVSVELEVKTREESVDMEADNTSMTTIPIRISDSFESMNGMMLS